MVSFFVEQRFLAVLSFLLRTMPQNKTYKIVEVFSALHRLHCIQYKARSLGNKDYEGCKISVHFSAFSKLCQVSVRPTLGPLVKSL